MTSRVLLLTRAEVAQLLDTDRLLDVLAEGFWAISSDFRVSAPERGELAVGETGRLLTMPAYLPGQAFSTKLVGLFPGNVATGLPSHLGLIVLMDSTNGQTLALMDAEYITAMRTAGAAALAARHLACPHARVMTIVGAGVQGAAHLDLIPSHFALETILIASRDRASAERLAERDPRAIVTDDIEAAVRWSDIVCLCSAASTPLIHNAWLRPGQHISSVGFAPPGGELDPAIARDHRLFVEAKAAFAAPPAGCAELAGIDPAHGTELGAVLLGRAPGRESAEDITVYKAMGHAIEDLVVANMVYRQAIARAIGRQIEL